MSTERSYGWEGEPAGEPKKGRKRFAGYGVQSARYDSVLDGISASAPVVQQYKTIDVHAFLPMPCPCCGQAVAVPTLDIIIENYGISEFEARILGAIWRGKGRPVATERVFDAMYCDDPDGGPSRMKMYEAFKFGLHRLRKRLEGSGVSVENVGYRRGFRLVMKDVEK